MIADLRSVIRRALLGRRWLIFAALILITATTASVLYQYRVLVEVVEIDFARQIRAEAALLADVIAPLPQPERLALRRVPAQSERRITLIAADGTVLADSQVDPASMENHAARPEVAAAAAHGSGLGRRMSGTLHAAMIYAAHRLPDGSIVRVAAPLRVESGFILHAWAPMAVASALVVLVAGLLVVLQLWRDRHRFGELAAIARSYADERYDQRAALLGRDALARLGGELNALGDRLAVSRAALTAQQALLDGALGALDEGVGCVDALDRVVYANAAFHRLACASSVDVVGTPYYAHIAVAELAGQVAAVRAGAGAQPPIVCEHLHRHLLVAAVPAGGAVTALILRDRTDLVRLEAMRRSFVASVSHEFKTPLTAIIGYADTLLGSALREDPEAAVVFIERISAQAERLSVLVRDVLTLSRLEQGAWEPAPTDFDLTVLGESLLDDQRCDAIPRGIVLALDAPASLPVRQDAEILRQLIGNLLSNAVRYNRPDGRVDLRLRRLTGGSAGDLVQVVVADTGIGIPPTHQARVFERFYRVDSHRSRSTGGTGLGLAIVKHFVETLRGSIVFSSSDQGTTFTVEVPELLVSDDVRP